MDSLFSKQHVTSNDLVTRALFALCCVVVGLSLTHVRLSWADQGSTVPCTEGLLLELNQQRSVTIGQIESTTLLRSAHQAGCSIKVSKTTKKILNLKTKRKLLNAQCASLIPLNLECASSSKTTKQLKKQRKKRRKLKKDCAEQQDLFAQQLEELSTVRDELDAEITQCLSELNGPPLDSLPPVTQCNDGIDNDGDGLVDQVEDPGCTSAQDDSENSEGSPAAAQITQSGITFYFDKPYSYGQFANGDYWVAPDEVGGTVTVVEMDPKLDFHTHGWEVNPSRAENQLWQGFDHRVNLYKSSLRPPLPLTLSGGQSLVKVYSDGGGNDCTFPVNKQCLLSASVLTVLDRIPAQRGARFFRPPYVKGDKSLVSIDSIDWSKLPSYPLPDGAALPDMNSILDQVRRVQIDHLANHEGRHKPKLHYADPYGQSISNRNNNIVFALTTLPEGPLKSELTHAFIQYGLDLYAILLDGATWPAVGGHGLGRMLPVTFTAMMLNHQGIKTLLASENEYRFGETHATFINPHSGIALFGEVSSQCTEFQYWDSMRSHATARTCRDPYLLQGGIDGGERPGSLYHTQIGGTLQATYVLFNIVPGLKETLFDAGFMQYVQRFMTSGTHTVGDLCAPAPGFCVGGPNDGAPTNSALAASHCGGSSMQFEADMSLYGIEFGPDGAGGCILDQDLTDGLGRFPFQHGVLSEYGLNNFQRAMRDTYFSPP